MMKFTSLKMGKRLVMLEILLLLGMIIKRKNFIYGIKIVKMEIYVFVIILFVFKIYKYI